MIDCPESVPIVIFHNGYRFLLPPQVDGYDYQSEYIGSKKRKHDDGIRTNRGCMSYKIAIKVFLILLNMKFLVFFDFQTMMKLMKMICLV